MPDFTLLLKWNLLRGASRAVKYHGFATPPLKNFKKDFKKTLGTEIDINMRASAGLHDFARTWPYPQVPGDARLTALRFSTVLLYRIKAGNF